MGLAPLMMPVERVVGWRRVGRRDIARIDIPHTLLVGAGQSFGNKDGSMEVPLV